MKWIPLFILAVFTMLQLASFPKMKTKKDREVFLIALISFGIEWALIIWSVQ